MSETNYTEQNPWVLPSGRKLWRHSNNEGCVIEFDQYGKNTKLYVPDAKFRNFSFKEISSDVGWTTQLHTPILELNSYDYLLDSSKSYSQPFTTDEFLTDTELQTKLDSMLNNGTFANDFTAKQGTDAILASLDASSEAASFVRSLVPTNLSSCDIPNIYELAVIWLESDNIDSIDPTINEFNDLRIGSPNRFNSNYFWTCTEVHHVSYFGALVLDYDGNTGYHNRDDSTCVLPVLELSIKDTPKNKLITRIVVKKDGIAYKFKGVSLSNSNASTILDNLISDYTEQYNNLNAQITALENQLELGQVKFVTDMTTLNTEPLVNTLYVNNEVVGIVDDGSGIIPQVYLADGSSVSLKEVERKEEDPDDGNEYIGYVNKVEFSVVGIPILEVQGADTGAQVIGNELAVTDSTNDISYIYQYVDSHIDIGIKLTSSLASSILNINSTNFSSSALKITRLDTGSHIIVNATNYNDTEYMWENSEESFLTSEDIGKTIQFRIERNS